MCGRHHSQFLKLRRELLLFIKAEMSSVEATAVDYGVTILLTEGLGIYYALSNLVGCVSGGVTNCCINLKYVFGNSGRKKKYVALRYLCVWALSILLNSTGTWLFTELSGFNYIIVKMIVGVAVGIIVNYPGQKLWVFRKVSDARADGAGGSWLGDDTFSDEQPISNKEINE